jgi:hypothetical protein
LCEDDSLLTGGSWRLLSACGLRLEAFCCEAGFAALETIGLPEVLRGFEVLESLRGSKGSDEALSFLFFEPI